MLCVKVNDDVASFVAPKYSSASIRLIHISSPVVAVVVILEITTQLLPTGHKEVQTKVAPDPDEVYPGKQTHNKAPTAEDEPDGQIVQTKVLPEPDEAYPAEQVHQAPSTDEEPRGQAVHVLVVLSR